MKKRNDYEFRSDLNPTYDFIHINNQNIKVQILKQKNAIFELNFNYKEKNFTCKLEPIHNKEHQVNSDEIIFEGIILDDLDRRKLAEDINKIIDSIYD